MTPEFSHIIKLSELGTAGKAIAIEADEKQRNALAKRFDLPSIMTMSVTSNLQLHDEEIHLSGTIDAKFKQFCSIRGEPFPASVMEKFAIIFLPRASDTKSEEEIELTAEECDIIEYEGNQIDIGEAIAQTFFLALDPYPRGPNADTAAEKQGLKSEEEAGPFGALASLKDKLG